MRFLPSILLKVTLVLTLSGTPVLKAQNQTSNYGKEFRFTLLENYGSLDKVSFVVSLSKLPDTIRIRVGVNYFPHPVYKNLDTIISYTKLSTPNAFQFGPNKGVHISSNHPISLYVLNNVLNSSDISSITPVEQVPENPVYYVNTYRGDESFGKANNSLFSVLAIDDSVRINIMPTADSKYNLIKNTPFSLWLRKGQVFYEQASDSQSFAGTRIWNSYGCKRFVVFEGAKCSYVDYSSGNCRGCDHLYNQTRPQQLSGTRFTTVPYTGMGAGYYYQIVAFENNTTVKADGILLKVLNQGESFLVNQSNNASVCIEADKNISLVQLMKSGECNGQADNLGNPSLMNVIPDDQTMGLAGFSFPTTSNIAQNPSFPAEFYVAIAARPGKLGLLRLNGQALDTSVFVNNCNLSVASFKLNPTLKYKVSSSDGFIAYMYAYGKDESYAGEIGAAHENEVTRMVLESNLSSTCDSFKLFTFKGRSDSAASFFWNFGDGSSAAGDSVSKRYARTGTYRLTMAVRYTNVALCSSDTFAKLITVRKRPYFSLGKDTVLCTGDFFQIAPVVEPKVSFLWHNGASSQMITVNRSQKVWLTLNDSNQCAYTDTLNLIFSNCDTNSIIIPNVFTPGRLIEGNTAGDDINDYFETRFSGYDELRGIIYNRWGQAVYEFEYPKDPYWNGCLKNNFSSPCPSGTYYYLYEFYNRDTQQKKSYHGVVQLIR